MNDPRGDPFARRAADLLRREPIDQRAVERVIAAVRETANGTEATHASPSASAATRLENGNRAGRRLSLIPALAAAAVIFALGIGVGTLLLAPRLTRDVASRDRAPDSSQAAQTRSAAAEPQLVEFVLVAPRASRVSLVGEFNGWDAGATPMRHSERGDGTWSVSIPLGAGRHVYAFVIDNSTWIPDPQAPLAPERWFGERNSVVVVSGGPRS